MLQVQMNSLLCCQCTCSRLCCTYTAMACCGAGLHAQLAKATVRREGPLLLEPALLHSQAGARYAKLLVWPHTLLCWRHIKPDRLSVCEFYLTALPCTAQISLQAQCRGSPVLQACMPHPRLLVVTCICRSHSLARWSLHRSQAWCLAQV